MDHCERYRRKWTPKEDKILKKIGPNKESIVYQTILDRNKKECAERYNNHLSDKIKTPLSLFEIKRLPQLLNIMGTRWTKIGELILLPEPLYQKFLRLVNAHNLSYALQIMKMYDYPVRTQLSLKNYWARNGQIIKDDSDHITYKVIPRKNILFAILCDVVETLDADN